MPPRLAWWRHACPRLRQRLKNLLCEALDLMHTDRILATKPGERCRSEQQRQTTHVNTAMHKPQSLTQHHALDQGSTFQELATNHTHTDELTYGSTPHTVTISKPVQPSAIAHLSDKHSTGRLKKGVVELHQAVMLERSQCLSLSGNEPIVWAGTVLSCTKRRATPCHSATGVTIDALEHLLKFALPNKLVQLCTQA